MFSSTCCCWHAVIVNYSFCYWICRCVFATNDAAEDGVTIHNDDHDDLTADNMEEVKLESAAGGDY